MKPELRYPVVLYWKTRRAAQMAVGDGDADHIVADGALLLAALEVVDIFGFADGGKGDRLIEKFIGGGDLLDLFVGVHN